MEQYIAKSALVEEIENLVNIYKKCPTRNFYEEGLKDGRLLAYEDVLYEIDSFEVKEVDLNEEIESYFKGFGKFPSVGIDDCIDIAKYFFEFGLKAQKGEL